MFGNPFFFPLSSYVHACMKISTHFSKQRCKDNQWSVEMQSFLQDFFLIYFEQLGLRQLLGSAFPLIWSVVILLWEECAFYCSCMQVMWDNSCLGIGLLQGYFGPTHHKGLRCILDSRISEGTYCLPELCVFGGGLSSSHSTWSWTGALEI